MLSSEQWGSLVNLTTRRRPISAAIPVSKSRDFAAVSDGTGIDCPESNPRMGGQDRLAKPAEEARTQGQKPLPSCFDGYWLQKNR
jgi:hypothetical protein